MIAKIWDGMDNMKIDNKVFTSLPASRFIRVCRGYSSEIIGSAIFLDLVGLVAA